MAAMIARYIFLLRSASVLGLLFLPPVYAAARERLRRGRTDGYRDFVALLLLHQEFPAEAVHAVLEEALARDCLEPAAVRQLLLNRTASPTPDPVTVPAALARLQLSPPDLSRYDLLLPGVVA